MSFTPAPRLATPGQPLRIGVALEGASVPSWLAQVLNAIEASPDLAFALLMRSPVNNTDPQETRDPVTFRAYEVIDRLLMNAKLDPLHDVEACYPDVQQVAFEFAPNELGRLDVVLWFLAVDPTPDLAQLPRYGIWSLGPSRIVTGRLPRCREMFEREPVLPTILTVDGGGCGEVPLVLRSYSATHMLSLWQNRRKLLDRAATLTIDSLQSLANGPDEFVARLSPAPTKAPGADLAPSSRIVARHALFTGRQLVRNKVERAFRRPQWFFAIRCLRSATLPYEDTSGYTVVTPPPDRFFADPMLIERDKKHYVFFEDFTFEARKAVISCAEIIGDGLLSAPRVVLERPYHLSYPNIWEWEGEVYMVPETSAASTIELYRADPFPDQWVLEKTLISGIRAFDSTFLAHGGRLWLFTNVWRGSCGAEDLCLFSANCLAGPWVAHPLNPVVLDIRKARPAGPILELKGELVRPAQDCTLRYGRAITFQQIERLDEVAYEEVEIGRLDPDWLKGNLGSHCYSRSSTYEALDGRRLVRRNRRARRRTG